MILRRNNGRRHPSLFVAPGWIRYTHRIDEYMLAAGLALLLLLLTAASAQAQDVPPPLPTPRPDSTAALPDALPLPDSLARSDTTRQRLATPPPPSATSSLDKPIEFSGTDSLVIRFDDEHGDHGRLVGNAVVTYGEARLEAYTIDILFDINELHASGLPVDTGMVGMPRFQQGTEDFTGFSFAYNMETGRGRVVGAQTNYEDGFIRAGIAKVLEDSTLFIQNGQYTTCDCAPTETPSYSLRSNKMKVVNQKWIYTGPIQLFIYNIPMPLWLPFGFLPAQEGRRSGILTPDYGEDRQGFYLRNMGYYWAMNDYMDLQVLLGLWTRGSWEISPTYRYRLRDRFSGSVSVSYVHQRNGEKNDPGFSTNNVFRLLLNHNQTLSPTARLTANVNFSTSSTYYQRLSVQYDDNVRQDVSSSIQYNKQWRRSGRSLSLNFNQRQVLATGEASMTLPQLRFSQRALTPFRSSQRDPGQNERWYEKIQISYSGTLRNQYTFKPLPDSTLFNNGDSAAVDIAWYDALFDQSKYERATGNNEERFDFKATHRIPISATFSMNRLPILNSTFRLNISPRFNYTEDWFIETDRRTLIDSTNTRVTEAVPGFFALRQFDMGVSANTTIYGIFPWRIGPYQGFRHTLRPTIGFSYKPDFSDESWGYTRPLLDDSGSPVRVDTTTNEVVRYAIAQGVRTGLQQSLTFGLNNTFETKRVTADSTGEQQSRTLKLFDLNLGSSYNFAADSLKLAPIRLSARTKILGKLDVNISSTLSPYATDSLGRAVNDYVFSLSRLRFARITSFNIRGGFQLRSRQQGPSRPSTMGRPGAQTFNPATTSSLGLTDPFATSGRGITSPDGTTDFSIPWSLSVDFTYSISKPGLTTRRTATVNTSFDFNLTPNWKLRGRTGYDVERNKLATTSLNIRRDFTCWEMAFSWVPFGQFQSWGFDLRVKSGQLSNLLRIQQPRQDRDRGLGSRF